MEQPPIPPQPILSLQGVTKSYTGKAGELAKRI